MSDRAPYVRRLVDLARAEWESFHEIDESDEPLRSRIDLYCRGIGLPPPEDITEFAWSATFVSWCVKSAGATAEEFKFSARHSEFVRSAIANADAGQGVFQARRIDAYSPKIGDIIQSNRQGGAVDYDEARRRSRYASHSAIVVELVSDGNPRFAVTIGGNEGNTVRRTRVALTSNGRVKQRASNPYICVIENLKADAPVVAAAAAREAMAQADAEAWLVARRAASGRKRAHGPVVEALQLALGRAGFPVPQVDGDFGNDTLRALNLWQKSQGLAETDGISAAEWRRLTGGSPPSIFDLCLQLTASFEGTGFTGAVGNFDGAGVTFGIIGFTARHGELGELVAKAKARDASILVRAFGPLAGELEEGLAGPEPARVAFGDEISMPARKYNLRPEWRDAFARFGSEAIVKRLQIERAYDVYWAKARQLFRKYGLADARDASLLYDVAVQNGGVKPAADAAIGARLPGAAGAEARRLVIAEEVRDASASRWQADVFSRKSSIASGDGEVHGARYDLYDWGLADQSVGQADLDAPSIIGFDAPVGAAIVSVATVPATGGRATFASRSQMLSHALSGGPPAAAEIGGQQRLLNAAPDTPDLRDRMYTPTLADLKPQLLPAGDLIVLDQGREGACTGFALAAAINRLNAQRRKHLPHASLPDQVSQRMLYEMARLHDEWPGESYAGSSLRGAMKGFFHNGVCRLQLAPYHAAEQQWTLSVVQAKDARNVTLGAYYRLRPDATHYHAALNEVDIICTSARVHEGWRSPQNGRIVPSRAYIGGHAFAIVGYDDKGFFVQNSWGPGWGGGGLSPKGVAHWAYEDWAENVLDAWVLRLSVPTPDAFNVIRSRSSFALDSEATAKAGEPPRREEINGHIINIDDGVLQERGRYATPLRSLIETADLLANPPAGRAPYQHVMFYAHGGLNSLDEGAQRAAALREPLKRNGIYPIFFLWGTDFPNEFKDAIDGAFRRTIDRVGAITDFTDRAIEVLVGKVGRAVWREIKRDADAAFLNGARRTNALSALKEMLPRLGVRAGGGPRIHLVGHSAGAVLLGHMLSALQHAGLGSGLGTVQLLAPACTVPFYQAHYVPALAGQGRLSSLDIYNLTDEREQDDSVFAYRKSLLYLVSNAFEDRTDGEDAAVPLLGMQTFAARLAAKTGVQIWYAGLDKVVTDSQGHGGFDNDVATMNSVVARILGRPPSADTALQASELGGY